MLKTRVYYAKATEQAGQNGFASSCQKTERIEARNKLQVRAGLT
jgi:hypothetical protein